MTKFGGKCANEIHKMHLEIERNPPKVVNYDAWGNRIDKLIVCPEWKAMKKIAATEGLIAIPYEKNFSIYSRLYQILKLYLFAPSSGLFSCPLAMTDGAAKTIQNIGLNEFNKEAFARLTSRDPNKFWTSGQVNSWDNCSDAQKTFFLNFNLFFFQQNGPLPFIGKNLSQLVHIF